MIINSVDRDGTGEGYDIELIKKVYEVLNIPLIPCGGVGIFDHFSDILEEIDLTAVSAGNIFNFTERSYEKAKIFLKKKV